MTLKKYLVCSVLALLAVSLWLFADWHTILLLISIFGMSLVGFAFVFLILRWIWRAGSAVNSLEKSRRIIPRATMRLDAFRYRMPSGSFINFKKLPLDRFALCLGRFAPHLSFCFWPSFCSWPYASFGQPPLSPPKPARSHTCNA